MFEKGKTLRKYFDLMETTFWVKPVKRDKYYYGFPPQNEPHTAKLSFAGVIKHYHGK